MWLSNKAWSVFTQQLLWKDEQLKKANERIDRLVEALAAKQNIPLIMPQAELPQFKPAPVLEKIPGHFDYFNPKPVAPTPPSGAHS
jgi:hypothetical protein